MSRAITGFKKPGTPMGKKHQNVSNDAHGVYTRQNGVTHNKIPGRSEPGERVRQTYESWRRLKLNLGSKPAKEKIIFTAIKTPGTYRLNQEDWSIHRDAEGQWIDLGEGDERWEEHLKAERAKRKDVATGNLVNGKYYSKMPKPDPKREGTYQELVIALPHVVAGAFTQADTEWVKQTCIKMLDDFALERGLQPLGVTSNAEDTDRWGAFHLHFDYTSDFEIAPEPLKVTEADLAEWTKEMKKKLAEQLEPIYGKVLSDRSPLLTKEFVERKGNCFPNGDYFPDGPEIKYGPSVVHIPDRGKHPVRNKADFAYTMKFFSCRLADMVEDDPEFENEVRLFKLHELRLMEDEADSVRLAECIAAQNDWYPDKRTKAIHDGTFRDEVYGRGTYPGKERYSNLGLEDKLMEKCLDHIGPERRREVIREAWVAVQNQLVYGTTTPSEKQLEARRQANKDRLEIGKARIAAKRGMVAAHGAAKQLQGELRQNIQWAGIMQDLTSICSNDGNMNLFHEFLGKVIDQPVTGPVYEERALSAATKMYELVHHNRMAQTEREKTAQELAKLDQEAAQARLEEEVLGFDNQNLRGRRPSSMKLKIKAKDVEMEIEAT